MDRTQKCILAFFFCIVAIGAEDGFFYGGSISYNLVEEGGRKIVNVDLITGWKLGKGPCGANCSKESVNTFTNNQRLEMERTTNISNYFGNFSTDSVINHATTIRDLNSIVHANYTELVIAVNEHAMWEQELMKFSFEMLHTAEDVTFEGNYWRPLTYGNELPWHFQTKVVNSIRSDTKRMNSCPQVMTKPFYRIKLGKITTIRIPMIDPDGDIVRCFKSAFIEVGRMPEAPGVRVYNESQTTVCKVSINADKSLNYSDNTWVMVPITFRDYNTKPITFINEERRPGKYSLSSSSAQFVVQVLENLVTPEFVSPTIKGDHMFIVYADSVWTADIYVQAPVNTTIDEFIPSGRYQENVTISSKHDDTKRERVMYVTMSWTPSLQDVGQHILCMTAVDNTGVDSEELRCYTLEVREDRFNHSSSVTVGKPYFIDIPSTEQFVNCKLGATCLIPVYVKSRAALRLIEVTESFLEQTTIGKMEVVTHKGESAYKAILSFTHSMPGVEKICLSATDENNVTSDEVCINSEIEAPDPCLSTPCRNSATCRSNTRKGTFVCDCISKQFQGTLCEIKLDICGSNACIDEQTANKYRLPVSCYCVCKPGFEGHHCETNTYDCRNDSCDSTRGTCRDLVNGVTCDCYQRYSGKNCTVDNCPTAGVGVKTCPVAGCSPGTCSGHGVCSQGGKCTCRRGYNFDSKCSASVGHFPGVTGVKFVSPTPKDKSQFTCVIAPNAIKPCHVAVYVATSTGLKPTLQIETTSDLSANTTIGRVESSTTLLGITDVYSAEIVIRGSVESTTGNYICLTASEGSSEAELCLELKFISEPHLDPLQKNATIKFIEPTQVEGSKLVGYVSETYTIMMFTTYTSTCENVISTTDGVTVFAPDYDGNGACVTEASFAFTKLGTLPPICFQSAESNFQKRCFTAEGLNKTSDPCLSSPCQNNGHCFPKGVSGFQCICQAEYIGTKCEEGPCPTNVCQHDAYCKIKDGYKACICKAGYTGPKCEFESSQNKPEMTFTDAAKPKEFECVVYQPCSIALLLSGHINTGEKPHVIAGYVSPTIILGDIQTVDRHLSGSYQVNIHLKAKEEGLKDVCVQSLDKNGVNKDELCFKVNVITEVSGVYGNQDRPHFVYPSLPNDAEVECQESEPCHVLYEITPGDGNEKQCVTLAPTEKVDVQTYHVFSSCEPCTPGLSRLGNCSVDISIQTSAGDVGQAKRFCAVLSLAGTSTSGESRCFDVSILSKAKGEEKKGCQVLECKNGGFCDGHIPNKPRCFCRKGYFGADCDQVGGVSSVASLHSQSFIGDLGVPSEIKCNVGETCYIPFEIVTAVGQLPDVSLGYADPRLSTGDVVYAPLGSSNTMYMGSVDVSPSEVGTFHVCLQTNDNSVTTEELCVAVKVTDAAKEHIDTSKPRFISPTLPEDSTVLCTIKKPCHLDLHSTKGDEFGVPGKCPSVSETSLSQETGILIFTPEYKTKGCVSDVTYTADAEETTKLCFQVSLPGKKGENRCFTVKAVTDITKEVPSPCTGITCDNGGKCLADLNPKPAKASCICAQGFSGSDCKNAVTNNTTLPGIQNLPNTAVANQHFDSNSAVPKDVKCDDINPCCVVIPYHGDSNQQPSFGFKDTDLAVTSNRTLSAGTSQQDLQYFQTCVTGVPGKKHRMCVQTTTSGASQGINVDEICFEVEFEHGGQDHSTMEPKFTDSLSNGSSVLCQVNSTCHIPVITDKKAGSCEQVKECGAGIAGAYVFQTAEVGDKCVTDLGIKTSENDQVDRLCVSAGRGGEEREITVLTKATDAYGPCQKKHCLNGGRCNSPTETTAICDCPRGYSGTTCEASPCDVITCSNGGNCFADIQSTSVNASCICAIGFTGSDCKTAIQNNANLPGIENFSNTTAINQHFDGNSAVPKDVKCDEINSCCVVIPYHGDSNKPPLFGFKDVDLQITSNATISAGTSQQDMQYFQTCIKGAPGKKHRMCVQTSTNGSAQGINVDEICFEVEFEHGGQSHSSMEPKFTDSLSNGSSVLCQPNSVCHIPVITDKKSGTCAQVKECGAGIVGTHVFKTTEVSGKCVTDVAIKTSDNEQTDMLCISAGYGGEEREISVVTKASVEFGPCQKKHCLNGGRCNSTTETSAICECLFGYSGLVCEIVDPCTGITCGNGGKCIVDSKSVQIKAICICASGYTGNNCITAVQNNANLPGIESFSNTTESNQYFDSNSAVPKNVKCDTVNPCCVDIPYHGDSNEPPQFGFKDNDLTVTSNKTLSAGTSQQGLQYFQTCVNGVPGKKHRMCVQTTASGASQGVNVDEICFDVEFQSGGQDHSSTEPKFTGSLSNGSSVLCQPKSICHIPTITDKKSGSCEQVKECGTGNAEAHVFITSEIGGKCMTDVAIRTSANENTKTICLSAGLGGEERDITVVTKTSHEFGPCQKKHCINGGQCISATDSSAVCNCPPGYSGTVCETGTTSIKMVTTTAATTDASSSTVDTPTTKTSLGTTLSSSTVDTPTTKTSLGTTLSSSTVDTPTTKTSLGTTLSSSTVDTPTTKTTLGTTLSSSTIDTPTTKTLLGTTLSSSTVDTPTTKTSIGTTLSSSTVDTPTTKTSLGMTLSSSTVDTPTTKTSLGTTLSSSTVDTPTTKTSLGTTLSSSTVDTSTTKTSLGTTLSSSPVDTPTTKTSLGTTLSKAVTDTSPISLPTSDSTTTKALPVQKAPSSSSIANRVVISNTTACDQVKAKQHAQKMVTTGYASCFCMVHGKKVYIVKKRPVAEKKNMIKAAGFGAGGMVGTLVVGFVVYAIVNAIRPKKRGPTPRPPRLSRVHPNVDTF